MECVKGDVDYIDNASGRSATESREQTTQFTQELRLNRQIKDRKSKDMQCPRPDSGILKSKC